ncbi:hypothetical protein J132_10343, partial [Termitomyces sp. J132]
SPISILNARQKRICPVCTTHPGRPFMVEEGREWDVHCKTRVHRRLAVKVKQDTSHKHSAQETAITRDPGSDG